MVATTLGESAGYIGAWHDNEDDSGNVTSRDCGGMQVNIAARFIGTSVESALRTESLDPVEYMKVLEHNIDAGFDLYSQPWKRDGKDDIRRWQPWVAYTTGWATFPHAWVWHQEDGNPVGPWMPTGRYIYRAIAGQMNRHILITKDWTPNRALRYAEEYADFFGIKDATPMLSSGVVSFKFNPKPASPPSDGVGPRPVVNNGV